MLEKYLCSPHTLLVFEYKVNIICEDGLNFKEGWNYNKCDNSLAQNGNIINYKHIPLNCAAK